VGQGGEGRRHQDRLSIAALAPFSVRSFRFQWPADLAASWAFEMETLILGWYVLTATGSVQSLVVFGSLAWLDHKSGTDPIFLQSEIMGSVPIYSARMFASLTTRPHFS
jgi:hypothetical protein